MIRTLLLHMQAIAEMHGATLTIPHTLLPMVIESNAKSDFSRGVLATVAEVYWLACQSAEGRQALIDLGFEPVAQHVEGK